MGNVVLLLGVCPLHQYIGSLDLLPLLRWTLQPKSLTRVCQWCPPVHSGEKKISLVQLFLPTLPAP